MSHSKKPAEWEVFNIPPVKPVQYYSLLTKNREFSQLIQQYDTQVFKKGYLHYCGIVPKSTNSSLNNTFELFIVFFDEVPDSSFLGFRVNVSKETFGYESNSLLLFLKKSQKTIFYRMSNNCIHVQCGTNAWDLFYLLYDIYLRRYVLTIIGTRFFYHFVYSCCIQNEKQLLDILHKGSKVINISKKSIYYEIHRKRKISVTDLIHMTLNMPKNKRYIISSFSSKEASLNSNFKNKDVYTISGKKVHVSKLRVLKCIEPNSALEKCLNLKEGKPSSKSANFPQLASLVTPENEYESQRKFHKLSFSNAKPKRKFEDIEDHSAQPESSSSKYFKNLNSCSFQSSWEQYQNLKSCIAKKSLSIPFNDTLNSDLETSSSHHNLYSLQNPVHTMFVSGKDILNGELDVQNISELIDHKSKSAFNYFREDDNERLISFKMEKNYEVQNQISVSQDACSSGMPNFHNFKPYLDSKGDFAVKACDQTLSQCGYSEEINFDSSDSLWHEDENITTAAGRTISISTRAMQKAHQMIGNDFSDRYKPSTEVTTDSTENKKCNKFSNSSHFPSIRKSTDKYINVLDLSEDKSSVKNSPRKGDRSTTNVATFLQGPDKSFKHSLDTTDDVSFSTAAGKTINISNTAMEAAKKLIQNVFDEKHPVDTGQADLPTHSNRISKNKSAFKDIGFSSKVVDVDMDETLVQKFFEDTQFDEDDISVDSENVNCVLKSKNSNLSAQKPRKSLGGRRSLRYISDKL